MSQPIQKRAIKTRGRLIAAAEAVVAEQGYGALRVEEVVSRAGVAKGTFFAHFKDKDALMEQLVGQRIDLCLDALTNAPVPQDVPELVARLLPLAELMTCERYVFDLILRHSGAAAVAEIGPIAMTFHRFTELMGIWTGSKAFRKDVAPELLAEGIGAFAMQAMSLKFCALHEATTVGERLVPYLEAWLVPPRGA